MLDQSEHIVFTCPAAAALAAMGALPKPAPPIPLTAEQAVWKVLKPVRKD